MKVLDTIRCAFIGLAITIAPVAGLSCATTPLTPDRQAEAETILNNPELTPEEMERQLAALEAEQAQETAGGVIDLVGTVVPGANAFKPWLLGLVPLFFKRPRKHIINAVRQVNPLDGQMAPGEAVASLGKAIGFFHTSKTTAAEADRETIVPGTKDVIASKTEV